MAEIVIVTIYENLEMKCAYFLFSIETDYLVCTEAKPFTSRQPGINGIWL